MAGQKGYLRETCKRLRPHLLATFTQLGYTLLYFITEAAFHHGLSSLVYVTYRSFVAGVVMWPFAYFLERGKSPRMTWALFIEIFVLSLLGISLAPITYFASMTYTSPTFIAAASNSIPSLVFVVAVFLGLESLDIKSSHGKAKIIGSILSLVGVLTMTLFRGSKLRNPGHILISIQRGTTTHEDWLKGSLLVIASCLAWSAWYIMQAYTLKRYPAQLSLTTWLIFSGALQSAAYTVSVERKPRDWMIGFNVELWSIIYAGVVCTSMLTFIQIWCTKERGPVFLTTFNPLSTILVAMVAFFVLGEKLYLGSILGSVVIITGMYLVLWGKDKDHTIDHNYDDHHSEVGRKEADGETDDVGCGGLQRDQP